MGSNPGLVKSNTELPTARHRCNFSSERAVLQRWSRGHQAGGQGHKKKSEAKDSPSKDRHSPGPGQEC